MPSDPEYQRKYYAVNKDKIKARARAWELANPERVKERARKYRQRPYAAEKMKARARDWYCRRREVALFGIARRRARKAGMEFTIDVSEIVIPEVCPLLGIPIERDVIARQNPTSPSIDRIDPTKGYVTGNVWVVSWKANRMKCDATPDDLVAFATRVLKLFQT